MVNVGQGSWVSVRKQSPHMTRLRRQHRRQQNRFLETPRVSSRELAGTDHSTVKALTSNFSSSSLANANMTADYKILFCCLIFVD
ncbi:uncharacterized protein [Physcomitrium patens]|uniref:Uncharacterized protein n=1 Tax=Physcomitrium patens TaxID=3218 RepID=A0A7I4D7I9_PHYPA